MKNLKEDSSSNSIYLTLGIIGLLIFGYYNGNVNGISLIVYLITILTLLPLSKYMLEQERVRPHQGFLRNGMIFGGLAITILIATSIYNFSSFDSKITENKTVDTGELPFKPLK